MDIPELPDMEDLLTYAEGLPILTWTVVESWLERQVPQNLQRAACVKIGQTWLGELAESLGPEYWWDESEHFLLMVPTPEPPSELLLPFAEKCRAALLTTLPGVAQFPDCGKHIILVFANDKSFYQYLSIFYPEGEWGGFSGMQVRQGYPHIALNGTRLDILEPCLAHESTHSCLQHLQLPAWIEEGLAQMFEHDMARKDPFLVTTGKAQEHKRFWAQHGLADFWDGKGFFQPGKMQEHSYELAEILVRLLLEEHRPRWFGWNKDPQRKLFAFLRQAVRRDAGRNSALSCLGLSLQDVAAMFLGPGEWENG